jgi:hypothetical protein
MDAKSFTHSSIHSVIWAMHRLSCVCFSVANKKILTKAPQDKVCSLKNKTCLCVSQWPPVLTLFERGLSKGFGEDSKLMDGSDMKIAKVNLERPRGR